MHYDHEQLWYTLVGTWLYTHTPINSTPPLEQHSILALEFWSRVVKLQHLHWGGDELSVVSFCFAWRLLATIELYTSYSFVILFLTRGEKYNYCAVAHKYATVIVDSPLCVTALNFRFVARQNVHHQPFFTTTDNFNMRQATTSFNLRLLQILEIKRIRSEKSVLTTELWANCFTANKFLPIFNAIGLG